MKFSSSYSSCSACVLNPLSSFYLPVYLDKKLLWNWDAVCVLYKPHFHKHTGNNKCYYHTIFEGHQSLSAMS